jgi:ribosomal protein S18 acetylase RimI-like enzyme
MMAHLEPLHQRRQRILPAFFGLAVRHALAAGGVESVNEDGYALWLTSRTGPTNWHVIRDGLWPMPFALGLGVFGRMMRHETWCSARVAAIAPKHYGYLWVLGVEPSVRGSGRGRELVERTVERIGAAGLAWCFLKTEQPNNVPLYERLGFTCVDHAVCPQSGLPTWFFKRPTWPRS